MQVEAILSTLDIGMLDVRDATASRMEVSSASESSLPTSAPVFLAYLLGLLSSEGCDSPTGRTQGFTKCGLHTVNPQKMSAEVAHQALPRHNMAPQEGRDK